MTVFAKLEAEKPPCVQSHGLAIPKEELAMELPQEVATVFNSPETLQKKKKKLRITVAVARHRRRGIPAPRVNSTFLFFMSFLVLVDVATLLSVDPEKPGPITHILGASPTFHLCIVGALHLITLASGLSRTVNGCRLAMGINFILLLSSFAMLMILPSFIGSFVAAGLGPARNVSHEVFRLTHSENTTANFNFLDYQTDRFYSGFYSAILVQFLTFFLFASTVFQFTLVRELLVASHVRQIARLLEAENNLLSSVNTP